MIPLNESFKACHRSTARDVTFAKEKKISTCLKYLVAFSVDRPIQQLPAAWLRGTGVARGISPRRRHYRRSRINHW